MGARDWIGVGPEGPERKGLLPGQVRRRRRPPQRRSAVHGHERAACGETEHGMRTDAAAAAAAAAAGIVGRHAKPYSDK